MNRYFSFIARKIRFLKSKPDKILTVTTSNAGRSIGDVFLALFSCHDLVKRTKPVFFLTHSNHIEVTSFFHNYIDFTLLSDYPEKKVVNWNLVDIHCTKPEWISQLPEISNPWRYFVLNKVKPFTIKPHIPFIKSRLENKCVIIFPERSDNDKLKGGTLKSFISFAHEQGYKVYENSFINSNYQKRQPITGTLPLEQLSLTEIISMAQNPEAIILGTRSGLFDVLYFTTGDKGAKLVILYPDNPDWIWKARFYNEHVITNHREYFYLRPGVFEFREHDFKENLFSQIFNL